MHRDHQEREIRVLYAGAASRKHRYRERSYDNAGVYTILRSVQDIEIAEGDDTNISWQGPGYTALNGGKLQAYFNGEIRGGKFYGNLIIDTFKAIDAR